MIEPPKQMCSYCDREIHESRHAQLAELDTLLRLPLDIRKHYHGRPMSQLAAQCLLNESRRCNRINGGRRAAQPESWVPPTVGRKRLV